MGRHNQRWTVEEEQALLAGVEKHGIGKWRHILSDPQFASWLSTRSNVNLKDKWRNLGGNGLASSSREGVGTPMLRVTNNSPLSSMQDVSAVPLHEYDGKAGASRSSRDKRKALDFEAMVLEAVSSIEDPQGSDVNAIFDYMEKNYDLPQNYKKCVETSLQRLVFTGDLEDVDDQYLLNVAFSDDETSRLNVAEPNTAEGSATRISRKTLEDAASLAAYKVSVAEDLDQKMVEACEEVNELAQLLEMCLAQVKLAEDILEQCEKGYMVELRP